MQEPMYVGIGYYDERFDCYKATAYTYWTNLDLRVGDHVIAPTRNNPQQRGIVTRINMDKPPFKCNEITEYDLTDKVVDADGT